MFKYSQIIPAVLLASLTLAGATSLRDPWKGKLKYAAMPEHVRSAQCLRTNPFSADEILQWIDATSANDLRADYSFFGVTLSDERTQPAAWLKQLLTATPRTGHPTPPQKQFTASGCNNAICAARAIFGEQQGLQLMMMLGRFGLNGSQFAYTPSDSWNPEELDVVLLMLSDFPASTLPNRAVDGGFVRYPRREDGAMDWRGGGETIADSTGVYNYWNTLPIEQQRSFTFHELAHKFASIHDVGQVTGGTNLDLLPVWKNFSGGWKMGFSRVDMGEIIQDAANDPSKIVSLYGRISSSEDFAESVVAYRYNPGALKVVSSEKYDFIRETIFDGIEFTSAEACTHPTTISSRVKMTASQRLNQTPLPNDLTDTALRGCSAQLLPALLLRQASPEALDCIGKQLREAAAPIGQLGLKYPSETRWALSLRPPLRVPREAIRAVANVALDALKNYMVKFGTGRAREMDRLYGNLAVTDQAYCDYRVEFGGAWPSDAVKLFANPNNSNSSSQVREALRYPLQQIMKQICESSYGRAKGLTRDASESSVRTAVEAYFE